MEQLRVAPRPLDRYIHFLSLSFDVPAAAGQSGSHGQDQATAYANLEAARQVQVLKEGGKYEVEKGIKEFRHQAQFEAISTFFQSACQITRKWETCSSNWWNMPLRCYGRGEFQNKLAKKAEEAI
ncbi:unnamed protein product [Clonostachys rosea]|uniref:Uncharacterized protein n=1 Tax=Bionectria ochroleuca TaxID=29856 RepID=A0ABY6UR68_BIOOC|nr:unnamed protein product [Clonostachys rosea]